MFQFSTAGYAIQNKSLSQNHNESRRCLNDNTDQKQAMRRGIERLEAVFFLLTVRKN